MNLVSYCRVVKEAEVQQTLQPVFNNTIAVQMCISTTVMTSNIHLSKWSLGANCRNVSVLSKGTRIGVEGRLNTRRYTNKNHQEVADRSTEEV